MRKHLTQSLHRLRYPSRYRQLNTLLANQTLNRAQLLDLQQRDYAAMLQFATANVPYYRERLISASGEIPILRKEDVRNNLPDLLADNADPATVKRGHTGGSTGKPLTFWYDNAKHEAMRAGMMRGFMMSGWQPGDRILNFWGARHDAAKGGVFGRHWADWMNAEKTLIATQFDAATLQAWARFVQRYQPVLLYGYASAISELARFIVANQLPMPRSLIGVYSTAEILTEPQRAIMQQAFNCKVYNQYGCREVPNIAWECKLGNMHVFADLVRLESVRIEQSDHLIVTSLTNRLMPFIRYDLGDTGVLMAGQECACGSPFPVMEMQMCRQNDWLRGHDDQRIHPGIFNRLLDGCHEIQQYQWVQTQRHHLDLNLVTSAPLQAEKIATISAKINAAMGGPVTLNLHYLTEITRTTAGKHRYVIGLD
jgi:phenylacetate-CoA ligase